MSDPLRAHTVNEARYYLAVTPCDRCGGGPWVLIGREAPPRGGAAARLEARCRQCQAETSFDFLCEHPVPDRGPEAECVNPTPAPSHIIDLGQWLSLFYLLIESAASEPTAAGARRASYQAALCLGEALKFYADDELPPLSAFFAPRSVEAFREHPERFARQALRDMQAKLPALPRLARRVARDEKAGTRWWRVWRR